MEPQCTTAAECLREVARVMEQFGIDYYMAALTSKYVKEKGTHWNAGFPSFAYPTDWSFAIAEVEGKPVFPGDRLFCNGRVCNGREFIARYDAAGSISGETIDGVLCLFSTEDCSWNPPKPKTVMVEMLVEDVEILANTNCHMPTIPFNLFTACKKALEVKS